MFDMKSGKSAALSANLTVAANTQTTALVDMQGYNAMTAIVNTGTITTAGSGITFKLQHSDSTLGSSFVDVPAEQFVGTATAVTLDTQDNVCLGSIGYVGNLRYVRLAAVGAASSNGVVFAQFVRERSGISEPVAPVFTLTAAT
jgi:hypothetical protein